MSDLPSIKDCRGMSDPSFFAFDVLKNGTVICHGLVFTSLIIHDHDTKLSLGEIHDDPRMPHLVRYIWRNFLKEHKERLEREVKDAKAEADRLGEELARLRQESEHLKSTVQQLIASKQ